MNGRRCKFFTACRSAREYFVTMSVHNRECVFGEIAGGEMKLSAIGEVARECWTAIRGYIYNNPLQWHIDAENPEHQKAK